MDDETTLLIDMYFIRFNHWNHIHMSSLVQLPGYPDSPHDLGLRVLTNTVSNIISTEFPLPHPAYSLVDRIWILLTTEGLKPQFMKCTTALPP